VNDPAFTWSGASDSGGAGVKGYYWYFGTNPNADPTTWTTSEGCDPSTVSSGTYYLRVKTEDNAGNKSSPVTLFTFKYDINPPTGTIDINSGAASTNSPSVSLTLSCSDLQGCSQMKFSNDVDNEANYSTPETYSTTKAWTLSSGDGTKTVYVKFKDGGGNWSAAYSDSILLDTTPPTGTITINSGAASTTNVNVTLTLTCNDANGCSQMKFSNDVDNEANYSTPETYSTTKAWTLTSGEGTKTVYAKFKDTGGNWSTAYSDTINLIVDSNTKSLLHMNGTDASTTFTDSAGGGTHTWTAHGNAQIDTAQSKFGGASGLFGGVSGDYISAPDSNDWAFSNGNFTIDFWVRFSALPASGTQVSFFKQMDSGDHTRVLFDFINVSGTIYVRFTAKVTDSWKADYEYVWAPSTNTWYHVAWVRSGSTIYLFINGSHVTLTVYTAIGTNSLADVGAELDVGSILNGWLDEYRISKGIARWTSDFTPPNEEY